LMLRLLMCFAGFWVRYPFDIEESKKRTKREALTASQETEA